MATNSRRFFGSTLFRLLVIFGTLFALAAVNFAVRAGLETAFVRTTRQSEYTLNQMNTARQQPAVLGAATQQVQTKLNLYRPAVAQRPLPRTGTPPVFYRVPTSEPVVFLTIDDGVVPHQAALELMQKKGLVASLFLNDPAASKYPGYFKQWQRAGSAIHNHTYTHPHLRKLSFEQQRQEICQNMQRLNAGFGAQPALLRPPYGEFNDDTLRAAAECGQSAIVHWSVLVWGGQISYQQGDRLRPGDIVLLHFTENLERDLAAVLTAADAQNLHIGRLEDWLY